MLACAHKCERVNARVFVCGRGVGTNVEVEHGCDDTLEVMRVGVWEGCAAARTDVRDEGLGVGRTEGRVQRTELVHETAEAPHVALGVVVLARDLLGRHVVRRAEHRLRERRLARDHLREAKVAELYHAVRVVRQKHVPRLHVAVQHRRGHYHRPALHGLLHPRVSVAVRQRVHQLCQDPPHRILRDELPVVFHVHQSVSSSPVLQKKGWGRKQE